MSHYIPVILGTAREGRNSLQVANYVIEQIVLAGHTTDLIDVADFQLSRTLKGASSPALLAVSKKLTKANAIVIVTPEYNHGYPGELKIFIDTFEDEYIDKPIGFVGTGGLMGGARAIEQLRQVFVELGAFSIKTALYFPMVWTLFEGGKLKDSPAYTSRISKFLADLVSHAKI